MKAISIMINGLPGRMAQEVLKTAIQHPEKFNIVPFSLCGPEIEVFSFRENGQSIQLIPPEARGNWADLNQPGSPQIAVDFTVPSGIEENVDFYCRSGLPFVLGTTGGDYSQIRTRVAGSEVCAVAAPNMSAPILLLQAAFEYLAKQFPGSLNGWKGTIVESHQAGKVDTSGTAKKMIEYLKTLGIAIEIEDIEKIRDPEIQRTQMNVPEEYLPGHAYHTYTLEAPDHTVELGWTHNVRGRATYATGTLAAVRFVAKRYAEGVRGKLFSMLDVLQEGESHHE